MPYGNAVRNRLGLAELMVIAAALVGCGILPAPFRDTTVREGPCTLVLIQDGEQLTPPYRVTMSTPGPGLSDRPVMYQPAGWGGQVSMTNTFPGGQVEESAVDAPSFNGGHIGQGFQEPGTFHLAFDDGHCHQEFDVEVAPIAD